MKNLADKECALGNPTAMQSFNLYISCCILNPSYSMLILLLLYKKPVCSYKAELVGLHHLKIQFIKLHAKTYYSIYGH
jgi:hypothetical protein